MLSPEEVSTLLEILHGCFIDVGAYMFQPFLRFYVNSEGIPIRELGRYSFNPS